MDVRKMLARLNPAVCRFDIGRGGIPEWTPQDVAAALGMVPAGLGRELLCFLWWPDGAAITREDLMDLLRDAQLDEWMRRRHNLEAAQLAVHIAEEQADGTHGPMRGTLSRARSELAGAKADMWPNVGPQSLYKPIREAILREMAAPELCRHCGGRGQAMIDSRVITCQHCGGFGRAKVSDRRRADAIGRDEKTYRQAWRLPYEWLFDVCVVAEKDAANALRDALGMRG